jgi:hypothetical protein
VCKDGFRDVVRDAKCRQTGANDAAQVVKTLAIAIPPFLLARADEVIE